MKTITLTDLFTEQQIQDITAGYGEGVIEPEWYEFVRARFSHTDMYKDALYTLDIPLTPPTPKRPGVGVLMVYKGEVILVTKPRLDSFDYISFDGSTHSRIWGLFCDSRHATKEEITAWFQSGDKIIKTSGERFAEGHGGISQADIDALLKDTKESNLGGIE